jgi:hypothetical protein
MKKVILLFYISFTLTQINFGQSSTKSDWLTTVLQEQSNKNHRETIHLHINSTFLVVGETLLFKATCLNYFTNTVSELSSVAHIELIDETAHSVLQTKILLMRGNGQGDFYLPSTLLSGNYTLIAYTNWMKNFPSSTFFQKQITIINPFKKSAISSLLKRENSSIELFPEGEAFLAGVVNTIAYRMSPEKVKTIKAPIKILDEKSNVVLEFLINQSGIGKFEIEPTANSVYKALITDSLDQVFFEALPEVQNKGIGIHVTESPDSFKIMLSNASKEGHVKVLVQHKDLRLIEVDTAIRDAPLNIAVRKEQLPIGISQITISTSDDKVVCQRKIFNPAKTKALVNFQMEKRQYKTRDKVIIGLKMKDSLSADISISVRGLEKNYHINTSYLIENDVIEANSISSLPLDDLMLLHRNKYGNSDVKANKITSYLPEVRGNLLTGKVTKNDSILARGTNVYLSVPSKEFLFFISKTDSTGRFFFNTDQIYSDNGSELILQVNPETCRNCKVSLDSEGSDDYSTFKPETLMIDSSLKSIIERRSIQSQIENAYHIQKKDSTNKKQSTLRFYGNPDKIYRLADYVRFSTMEDIFIEYIFEVILRKENNSFNVKVMNLRKYERFVEDPLILIDGIPIFDQQQLMKYNPFSIDRIEVICRRYFYGSLEFQGIISVITNEGNGKNVSIPNKEKIIPLQAAKIYYSPNYSNHLKNLERIPDYRTQLFWNPRVLLNKMEQSLEFYTSDIEGDFEIILEGITKKGIPIYYSDTFQVSK